MSSRNAYVVCVNMLDNQLIECTLTADGTGHDCLQNIAQRINLNKIHYFGLQYVNKKLQFRWLDLDRPLKKQLDKSAHSPLLYFRVMFYVADAHTIRDETTRYQYYLQLKSSVIDGKLPCTHKQAILLGAYSLQAERGNHDPSKHTVEALQDQLLLPRNMCTEHGNVVRLIAEMLQLHHSLQGVTQDVAEMNYILEAQQLEGYGLDYFPAKDTSGQEILLGASFIGIFVKYLNGQPANYFKWSDINNLTQNKRNFNIETTLTEKTVRFHMDDPDMVKYVFKMCSLQHKFYHAKQHSVPSEHSEAPSPASSIRQESIVGTNSTNKIGSVGPLPDIQQSVQIYDNTEKPQDSPTSEVHTQQPPQENLYENTQAILEQEYAQSHSPPQDEQYIHEPPYPPSPQQSSTNVFPVRVPSYRPAPDYETIMRQRMDYMAVQQQQERTLNLPNIGRAQVYAQPELLAYSQPEMRMQQQNILHPHQIPSSTTATNTRVYPITVDRTHSLIIQPTYSTPELYRMSTAPQNMEQNLSPVMSYKLPPPYPRSTSNSYPDLAMQPASSPTYNSPDLVSRKNLNNTALLMQSRLDKSVENLAAFDVQQQQQLQQQQLLQQQQQQQLHQQQIQQVYSQRNEMPRPEVQFCSVPPAPRSEVVRTEVQSEEKEVFITDPPNLSHPPTSVPSQFIMPQPHRPLMASHSNPFDHYGSENPYENLPPAYVHPDIPLHPPVEGVYQNVDELDGPNDEEIQCIDTSEMPNEGRHQASDSLISGTSAESRNSPFMARSKELDPKEEPQHVDVHVIQDERNSGRNFNEKEERAGSVSPGQLDASAKSGLSLSRASGLDSSLDPTRAPKDDRRNLLETKLEEGQVFVEFELIAKKRAKCICTVGERDDNAKRNRFKDILPYDDTRVALTSTKSNPSGYINASNVNLKLKDKSVNYIAGQGPLEETVNAFWQMVWEQNIHVIAMLTGIEEGGKHKCYSYWPQTRGPKNKLKFGDYEVYTKLCQNSGSYITSRLSLTHKKTKKERAIWHLQYVGWPDHGCPEDTFGFQCYLEELEAVSRQLEGDDKDAPVLVHCSAGVGRSGVLILTHVMRHCLDLNQDVAVPAVLEKMRAQRMHMVQTVTQYTFVYHCLVDYLKSARLI